MSCEAITSVEISHQRSSLSHSHGQIWAFACFVEHCKVKCCEAHDHRYRVYPADTVVQSDETTGHLKWGFKCDKFHCSTMSIYSICTALKKRKHQWLVWQMTSISASFSVSLMILNAPTLCLRCSYMMLLLIFNLCLIESTAGVFSSSSREFWQKLSTCLEFWVLSQLIHWCCSTTMSTLSCNGTRR